MQAHDCLTPLVREENVNVRTIVLEEVFGEDGRAVGVTADGEVLLPPFLTGAWGAHLESLGLGCVEEVAGELL